MHKSSSQPSLGWIANNIEKIEGIPDAQRRRLLRAGLGVGLASTTLLLAACGGGDAEPNEQAGGTTPIDPEIPRPNPPVPPTDEDGGNTPQKISSFTLAVLPDTQFFSRYATLGENEQFQKKYQSTPFEAQTKWITAQAQALRIPFTIHLGDVVDQAKKPEEWEVADHAMKILENGGMPYSILAGNHDVLEAYDYQDENSQSYGTDAQRKLSDEPYLQHFSVERAKKQSTFGGRDPSGFHEYHIFEVDGNKFMVLSLSWRISDVAIKWVRDVLAQNATTPTILASHQLLNIDGDGESPLEVPYGQMLWDKIIKDNDQIFMTLNGHYHGAAHLTKMNDFGNAVEEMVVDYQMAYMGGNALMRHYEFDLTNGKIKVISFSPWVPEKPESELNQFDIAVLTAPTEQFEIDIDFKKRFSRFNPDFKIPEPGNLPLNDQAKAIVLAHYTDPDVSAQVPPKDSDDYPKVASTVAHWRFNGGAAGQPVRPMEEVIEDLSGANNIHREALNIDGAQSAEVNDLIWSDDHHHLSAAFGSVQFLNAKKSTNRMSYFVTQSDAPINVETFPNGYTVEAFVKIDESWTSTENRWMSIMQHDGRRSGISGIQGGFDGNECPVTFAVSSLREIQWEIVSTGENKRVATNWSGEIIAGKWIHIAIVNNAAKNETIMYVEGAPVLRNAYNANGMSLRDGKTTDRVVIGGGAYNGRRENGFLGNIGEIRLCSEPLTPEQWLTARRSES